MPSTPQQQSSFSVVVGFSVRVLGKTNFVFAMVNLRATCSFARQAAAVASASAGAQTLQRRDY